MIIFEKVKWRNLLGTGNYWIEVPLNKSRNTLVIGENGSGKSTMLCALCFALFGKAFRNINKPNLLNSQNQKDLLVEVEFTVHNKKYRVVRGIKPNIFEIYQDGDLINQQASSKDYQEVLEKSILKLNYKSFTQIVILGSASFTPFMQLSAADRRAIIEDLLDIQIFSTMNSIIKDRIINNKDVTVTKKHEINMLTQRYELQEKHLDKLLKSNSAKIVEYQNEIVENQNTIVTLNDENVMHEITISNLNIQLSGRAEVERKIKQFTKLESQIENNVTKVEKDIQFFCHNDNCPTCKQDIEESFKQDELVKLHNKIEEFRKALSDLVTKIAVEQEKLDSYSEVQKKVQALQLKVATNNTSIQEINRYIAKLQKQIVELGTSKSASEKEEQELNTLKADIVQKDNELKALMDEKVYYEIAFNLLKDTGIKTKIIKQYLPVINKLINKYLNAMDFFVNFNLDESFKETIKSRFRDEFSYENFSEGEKMKINLSLLFAWRAIAKMKNTVNTNLLIMDEVLDSSLDMNGIDNFLGIIGKFDEHHNIFVISHRGDTIVDKFQTTMKFQKERGFSRLVS